MRIGDMLANTFSPCMNLLILQVTDEIRKLIDDINKATDAQALSQHVNTAIAKVSGAAFLSTRTE